MNKIDILIKRLNQIGIEVKLSANIPWIYLVEINGKKVQEKIDSEHGFVIGYYPIRFGEDFTLANTKKMFNLIRKYQNK